MTTTAEKLAYSIADLTRSLGLSKTKLYSDIAQGRLVITKAGGRTLVMADDFKSYVANMTRSSELASLGQS